MVGTAGSGLGGVDRSQPVSAISSEVVGSAEGRADGCGGGRDRRGSGQSVGVVRRRRQRRHCTCRRLGRPGCPRARLCRQRQQRGDAYRARPGREGPYVPGPPARPRGQRAATVGVFVHLPGGGAERRDRQLGGIGSVEGGLSAVAVFHPSLCRGAGERQSERCDGIAPVVGRNRRIRWLADPCYRPFGMSDASWRLRGGAEFGRDARLGRRRI